MSKRTKFYQGYILPLLDYGSVVCGAISSKKLDRIMKLQTRTARIVLCADFTTPSSDMFQEFSWLPVNKRLKYNKVVFTYKTLNNLLPQHITDLLKPIPDAHSRSLRSSVSAHWLFQGHVHLCLIGLIPHQNCGIQFLLQYAIQLHYPVSKKISNRYLN